MPLRATFVMEQHLGHQTYYQNLRRFVEEDSTLQATWIPVHYARQQGLWERLPLVPRGLKGSLRGRSEVRNGLAQSSGDVVFFNTQVPALLGSAMAQRRPYVIATDITPLQYDQLSHFYGHRADRLGLIKSYKHMANVHLLRRAAYLLPWSNWAKQSLIRDYGVAVERIEVVPPGVDLELWRPGAARVEGPLKILFVGGDLFRKGGEILLEAFRSLPRDIAELHIVTRTRIAPEDGVRLYHDMQPNSPELVALYQSAHVFVLPTLAEAFGIAAAEATATGIAAVVTAVGGLTDIVADEETGYLVPPGDVATLRARLIALAEDPALRERMGRASRARAERFFDAQHTAARIIKRMREAAQTQGEVRHVVA